MDRKKLARASVSVLSLWAVSAASLPKIAGPAKVEATSFDNGLQESFDMKKRVNQDHGITHFYEMGEEKILNLGYSDCYSNCHTDEMIIIPSSHTDYTNCFCYSECYTESYSDYADGCYSVIDPPSYVNNICHIDSSYDDYPDFGGLFCRGCAYHGESLN